MASSPARLERSDAPLAMTLAASLGGAFALDRITRRNLSAYSDSGSANSLLTYGDYAQFAGPMLSGAFLFNGWLAEDSQSIQTSWELIDSFAWASAISELFKFSLGRRRPYATDDPFELRPGASSGSFPSGHTTAAFAAAATLSEAYPSWKVSVPAYAGAAAVGFSRIYANKHWGSDVVGGALLGYGVSHALHKRHVATKQVWNLEAGPQSCQIVWKF